MQTPATPLSQDQIDSVREKKLLDRRYLTIDLSGKIIPGGKNFHCWDCGRRVVSTIYKEPVTMIDLQVEPEDADVKSGSLCRDCNIMYLFI